MVLTRHEVATIVWPTAAEMIEMKADHAACWAAGNDARWKGQRARQLASTDPESTPDLKPSTPGGPVRPVRRTLSPWPPNERARPSSRT
jgi:hypothetical protein